MLPARISRSERLPTCPSHLNPAPAAEWRRIAKALQQAGVSGATNAIGYVPPVPVEIRRVIVDPMGSDDHQSPERASRGVDCEALREGRVISRKLIGISYLQFPGPGSYGTELRNER